MSEMNIDLLRADECQPLTNEQMNNIKSQFHPSNTANVNIVPYEIYDEDGVEIVVGEVRKTIDGVKKSKPRYRKIIDQTIGADADYTVFSSGIETGYLINSRTQFTTDWLSNGYPSIGTLSNSSFCYVQVDDGVLNFHNQTNSEKHWIATIEYTKTTDEWQPV